MTFGDVIKEFEKLKEEKGNGYISLETERGNYVITRSKTLKVLNKTTIGIRVEKTQEEITQMHIGEFLIMARQLGPKVLKANAKFYSEKSPSEFNHAKYEIKIRGVKNNG